MQYNGSMMLTYQYKLSPTSQQVVILETWGELLRRHYNYALGQRLDWLNRTRCQIDRCSRECEPIGEIPDKPDYYTQASGCGGYLDASPVKQQVSFVNLRCSRYTACG